MKPISPRLPKQLENWVEQTEVDTEVDRALVSGVDLRSCHRLTIEESKIESGILSSALLDSLELSDVVCTKLEAAVLHVYKARLLRVEMTDCRLTGVELGEASFEDCTFRDVRFDDAGFRFATFKRVRFENCMLQRTDFSNAKLTHVTFRGCDFSETNFVSAACKDVDIIGEDITLAKGILGLRGATISSEQLLQLAPLLASELGFRVEDTF